MACEWEDKFLRSGTKVSYETKAGFLKNKFYFNKKFIHAETTEELLANYLKNLEKIRSTDVKYLLQNDIEKKILYEKYYPIWTASCAKGESVFCRLASYLIEEKGDDASAQLLLQQGCQLNDYTSCYGLRLKNMNDPIRQKSHETLTLQACKNDDIDACKQFADLWKDNSELDHRAAYKEVLEKLCKAEDIYSCNYLIWEKYRI